MHKGFLSPKPAKKATNVSMVDVDELDARMKRLKWDEAGYGDVVQPIQNVRAANPQSHDDLNVDNVTTGTSDGNATSKPRQAVRVVNNPNVPLKDSGLVGNTVEHVAGPIDGEHSSTTTNQETPLSLDIEGSSNDVCKQVETGNTNVANASLGADNVSKINDKVGLDDSDSASNVSK